MRKQNKDAEKNAKEAAAKRQIDLDTNSKEWSEKEENEAKEKKGLTKEDREKLKKLQSKARNTFRKLLRVTSTFDTLEGGSTTTKDEYGFLSTKDVESICATAEVDDINDMNTAMGGEAATKDNAAFNKDGLAKIKVKMETFEIKRKEVEEDERIAKDAKKREADERNLPDKKRGHPSDREWNDVDKDALKVAVYRYPPGASATRWLTVSQFINDRIKPDLSFTQEECLIAAYQLHHESS